MSTGSSLNSHSDAQTLGSNNNNNPPKKPALSSRQSAVVENVKRTPLQRYWFTWQVLTAGSIVFSSFSFSFFCSILLLPSMNCVDAKSSRFRFAGARVFGLCWILF
jgi:hypothetical protein